MVVALAVAACASAPPLSPARLSGDAETRRRSLETLAQSLFQALRDQRLDTVLLAPVALDDLVTSSARFRIERERSSHRRDLVSPGLRAAWASASYTGFCAQGARDEPPGAAYGLRLPATVMERVLVVATDESRRSASWVEGRFVYTDRGWKALALSRVELPRAHHTDLELAPCDVEAGIR